jgi:HK97 family phage portal protein
MRWVPWLRRTAQSNGTTSDLQTPSAWLLSWASGMRTSAGIAVGPVTAMTLPIYYACLRNISEDVGKLPLHTYRRMARGKERAVDHPAYALLHDAPNPDMSAMTFRETLTHHALAWGNGYAQILWDGRTVESLWPIHPSRVQVRRDDDGRLVYDVYGGELTLPGGSRAGIRRLRQENVLHIKGLGAEGTEGYSVLRLAAESLGMTLAAQTFGATFFGNGTTIGAILTHPNTLSEKATQRLRESWQTIYGGPGNANKMAILEEGMKYERLGIPPEEAQFLETRQFQVEEVCRWFRMPKSKIHDLTDSTYSNMEQQNLEYVPDTLMPWLVRWEQELKRKLFVDEPAYFAEHAVQGLLRGDQAARASFYKDLFGVGAISPNDIRELENMNSLGPQGDQYFVASNNFTPLAMVMEQETPEEPETPFPVLPGRNGSNGPHPEEED